MIVAPAPKIDPTIRPGLPSEAVFLQMGAIGDIISSLPAIQWESRRVHTQATVFCEKKYAPLFDRTSYARAIPLDIPYGQHTRAMMTARKMMPSVRSMQVFVTDGQKHKPTSESFQRDAWEKIGMGQRWEQIGLVFDRRDPVAEADLTARIRGDKPVLLINHQGKSAPFPGAIRLMAEVYQKLGDEFQIIDLSLLQGENFVDLLGLYDRAACLVTVDTSTLHLAQASSIPVVPLMNPAPWVCALPRANHLRWMYYDNWSPAEVIAAARSTVPPAQRLAHVYPTWKMSEGDAARFEWVNPTWQTMYREGDWQCVPCFYSEHRGVRTSAILGDERPVPFLKDLIEHGLNALEIEAGVCEDDAVILTNTDVGITPGTTEKMRRLLSSKGAFYAYRFDWHNGVPAAPTYIENQTRGSWDGGIDMVGVSRRWWRTHREHLLDMVIGNSWWDLAYRDQFKQFGAGELYGCVWHHTHPSYWQANLGNPGNVHNTALYTQWQRHNDRTRPYRWRIRK